MNDNGDALMSIEIVRLQKELEYTRDYLFHTKSRVEELEEELETEKQSLRNSQYEMDVLQVDFFNEKNKCEELETQNRELRRKTRNLQIELHEADRVTTKRLHRLIDKLENIEKEKKEYVEVIQGYEKDLEIAGLLCYVCRQGIKTASCSQCKEMFCRTCYESVEVCPFCRSELPTLPELYQLTKSPCPSPSLFV